jgi:hypothetical protein
MVETSRFATKQVDLTEFLPRAEQMLPIEQGENLLTPGIEAGFMM